MLVVVVNVTDYGIDAIDEKGGRVYGLMPIFGCQVGDVIFRKEGSPIRVLIHPYGENQWVLQGVRPRVISLNRCALWVNEDTYLLSTGGEWKPIIQFLEKVPALLGG